jgi:hypothetical protein
MALPDHEPVTRAERRALGLLLVVLACVYLPGLRGEILDWDDDLWFADPALQDPSLAFTTTRDRVWAPLLRLSMAARHAVFGTHVFAWHAVDLLLWLAVVSGVWLLLRRFGLPRATALAATALWACHPTKVEVVSWLMGSKDLESGAWFVGAALVAVTGGAAWAVAALVLGAVLTKAATFPIALVLLVAIAAREGWRTAVRRVGPAVVVAIVVAFVGLVSWSTREDQGGWIDRFVLAGSVHGLFWLKVWSLLGPPSAITALTPNPWRPLVFGVVCTGLFAALAWRDRRFAVPLAVWLLPQLPFLGVVDMGFWASDRHLFFPTLGVAVALAWLLERAPGVPLLLSAVLLVPTALRVPEWRSSIALWEADTERPGNHPIRWYKLGMAYGKAGRFVEAEAAFDRQLELRPDDPLALARRLVASLAADGSFTRADAQAAATLEPPPETSDDWRRAADALKAAGRPDLAVRAAGHAD